jgi:uncharacterized protein with GYD domain
MGKYLLQVSYSADGLTGVLKEGGTSRRATIEDLVKGVGGSIEAFYFAFGEDDVVVIADMPDHATMAAFAMTVSASGAATVSTTVLLTPDDIDTAAQKTVAYRRPGT